MAEIPFVSKEHAAVAREIEKKLLAVHEGSGILFASVLVELTPLGDDPAYDIWVGCARDMDEDVIAKATYLVLSQELANGLYIRNVEVHRGIARPNQG
jgi:hypothetical protein